MQLSIYVDDTLFDELDARAKVAGMSRSAFVEDLLASEAAGGDKRMKRETAFLLTGMAALLERAGTETRKRAELAYHRAVDRDHLADENRVEQDGRRAARG